MHAIIILWTENTIYRRGEKGDLSLLLKKKTSRSRAAEQKVSRLAVEP